MNEVLEAPQVAQKKKVILLRAYRPKTQMPAKVSPLEDKAGRIYTGQGEDGYYDQLTEQAKKDMRYCIHPTTVVTLTDGKIFDLNNPIDEANWKWIQKHPYVALDFKKGKANNAIFYVEDPAAQAKERVERTRKIDEARWMVRSLALEKKRRAAKILGLVSADSFEEDQLLDWLLSSADFTPESVILACSPENQERGNATIFFNELFKYKVIIRGTDGGYRQGEDGVPMGHTIDLVVDWMLDAKNADAVKVLQMRLKEVKTTGKK
jgi:hypothetical protein